MEQNIFIQMTKLHNAKGRISYITSTAKQENLYAIYETTERRFWSKLVKENRDTFKKSGTEGECIEARELIVALPKSFVQYEPNELLREYTEFFKSKYGVECISALHHNKRKTNYHIHLIFSERKKLPESIVKIATRNMFYDETGKHRRTKKEILDSDGNIRKGCYIVPKGEPYSGHFFEPKNQYFKSRAFLQELKDCYTELINQQIGKEENRLEVYRKDSIFLPTKKIGKNNPNEDYIKQNNKAVKEWNYAASFAASILSEDHVKEVKQREILERVKESIEAREDKFAYRNIIRTATKVVNRLVKEWIRLPHAERPDANADMFIRMIKYCRERVLAARKRERER